MADATVRITTSTVWAAHYCCNCGTPFAVPTETDSRWLSTRERFYCPNGHPQSYTGKSDADRAKEAEKALQNAEKRLQWAQKDAADQSERARLAERSLRAQKGVTTRIKNRVSKGVCPCCNRTFQDLQRHMAGKHPDYAATA